MFKKRIKFNYISSIKIGESVSLNDLNELYEQVNSAIKSNNNLYLEKEVSDVFFDEYKKYLKTDSKLIKGKHVSTLYDSGFVKLIPHQWFFIANQVTVYLRELFKYKDIFGQVFNDKKEEIVKELKENPDHITKYKKKIQAVLTDSQDQLFFEKFLTDYGWFRGGKTIDRGDFWVTATLNLAGLLHTDSSTFADICKSFIENRGLADHLMNNKLRKTIKGDARSIVLEIFQMLIENYGFEVILKTLDSTDGKTYKTKNPIIDLIKNFETIQTKEDLTTSNTLRFFEEHVSDYDGKFWYLTNQWANDGIARSGRDLNNFIEYIKNNFKEFLFIKVNSNEYIVEISSDSSDNKTTKILGINLIVYGAPGTGKSYYLEEKFSKSIRTVFHGEYSNSDFVGSIKPIMLYDQNNVSKVSYEFVPGPFAIAIKSSYLNPNENISLLIEEINRGDAANIFGEIFQLLDRSPTGESVYTINVSNAFEDWLNRNCKVALDASGKLKIPNNLSIVATMNSADQGVRPLDSAFKRRWRFLYMPIDFEKHSISNTEIKYCNQNITWKAFASSINEVLKIDLKVSEDKLIGPFFLKEDELINCDFISEKLLLYLWDDVLRISGKDIVFEEDIHSFHEVQSKFKNNEPVFSNIVHEKMGIKLGD